jgi:hypothetical protein
VPGLNQDVNECELNLLDKQEVWAIDRAHREQENQEEKLRKERDKNENKEQDRKVVKETTGLRHNSGSVECKR